MTGTILSRTNSEAQEVDGMPKLIDADALHTSIALYAAENAYLNDTALDVLKMVAKWISDAPTIDAEPVRRATWVYDSFTTYRCSDCNSPAPQYGYKKTYFAKTNYCPNCGKPMDGGVSECDLIT